MKTKISRILGVGVTFALLASLLVGALPASANVTSATLVLGGVAPGLQDDISQAGVSYTATFQIGATVTNPQVIIVSFPTGTVLAAATATLSASSGIATDAFSLAPATLTPTATGCTVTVPAAGTGLPGSMNLQGAIGAGALVQLAIANVTNAPATGTYTLGISTTTEPVPVASASFTLVAPTIPGVPGIVYGKNAAGNVLVTLTGTDVISTVINWSPQIVLVEVGPGTYDETLGNATANGIITVPAGMTVVATSGPGVTIITDDGPVTSDGVGGSVALMGATSIFDGFTVRGSALTATPAVQVNAGGATVRNCVLSNTGGPALNIATAATAAVSTGNTISGGGLTVVAGQVCTSTGDTFSVAATGTGITNNGTLTLSGATVNGASGTGLTNAAGTTTITGSSFSTLDVAVNATAGNVLLSTSTLDACGNAGTTAPNPRGAVHINGGVVIATGNTITNSPGAIGRVGAAGTGAGSNFKFNTLTDNTGAFANGGLGTLDATNNWWGSDVGPTVASTGLVLTNPWLIAEITNTTVNAGVANIGTSAATSTAVSGVAVAMMTGGVASANMNVIATGNYSGNPVTAAPPADTVTSFDVYIQGPAGPTLADTAIITFSGITSPLAQIWAYSNNQSTWVLCSNQRVDMFAGTVIVTVNGTAAAGITTPNLGNMSGLEFVLTQPAVAPMGAPAQGTLVPAVAAEDVRIDLTSFTWGAVAGAVSYNFELAQYLDVEDPFIPALTIYSASVETNGIILITQELDYLETYAWRVQAVRGVGDVGPWVSAFFTTVDEPAPPDEPDTWVIEQEPTQIEWPDNITIEIPPIETPEIPEYILWVVVAVGAILVIAVVVLIVRTRRVA